tara:strand:- start:383 stop:613 length:231 start_codon:yes stop_codon:yes gene_type:complete
MPKPPAPLQLTLVPANDTPAAKRRRNPVDPRLLSLARLLARQAAVTLWSPAPKDAAPKIAANDDSLPEIVRHKRTL